MPPAGRQPRTPCRDALCMPTRRGCPILYVPAQRVPAKTEAQLPPLFSGAQRRSSEGIGGVPTSARAEEKDAVKWGLAGRRSQSRGAWPGAAGGTLGAEGRSPAPQPVQGRGTPGSGGRRGAGADRRCRCRPALSRPIPRDRSRPISGNYLTLMTIPVGL